MQTRSGTEKVLVLLGFVCSIVALSGGAYYFMHQESSSDSGITTSQIQTTTPLTTTSASVTPATTASTTQVTPASTPTVPVTTATTKPVTTTTTVTGKGNTIGFKQCGIGMVWACREVSQGMEYNPKNPPPEVCGCNPASCPQGQRIMTSYVVGTWPDGTGKGTFSCSSEDPSISETY